MTADKALLILSGPTASAKSSLALQLGEVLSAEIVNIDSVQLYRGFDIGAAKPRSDERSQLEHHLYDCCEADEEMNVAEYCSRAEQKISELGQIGKRSLFVGGTTLYISSLLHGLAQLPQADSSMRAEHAALTNQELWNRLNELDPESAEELSLGDRQRVSRALEIVLLSGKTRSQEFAQQDRTLVHSALIVILIWPRDKLYSRIDERVAAMIDQGLVQEVQQLAEKYDPELPVFRSLGYRQVLDHLQGSEQQQKPLEQRIAQATRHYAKRQMTFWRNEPLKRGWQVYPNIDETRARWIGAEAGSEKLARKRKGFWSYSLELEEAQTLVQQHLSELDTALEKRGEVGLRLLYLDAEKLLIKGA